MSAPPAAATSTTIHGGTSQTLSIANATSASAASIGLIDATSR